MAQSRSCPLPSFDLCQSRRSSPPPPLSPCQGIVCSLLESPLSCKGSPSTLSTWSTGTRPPPPPPLDRFSQPSRSDLSRCSCSLSCPHCLDRFSQPLRSDL